MSEEVIGNYRVHPVASMFPLLEGYDYEELRDSIELLGQTYPIIVQDGVLLDGRNRLRACLDLKIDPRIQEYGGSQRPELFIESVNINRRHLDEDMRSAISAQIRAWVIAQQNAAKQITQGPRGAEGGRGKKKNPYNESVVRVSEAPTHARAARSTVGQIAEAAKVSHHKAAQALDVVRNAPELAAKVAKGQMKLLDAEKETRTRKPARKRPTFKLNRAVGRASKSIARWIDRCPGEHREEFKSRLLKECRELCRG
jgi:hypothetical protein